MTGPIFVVYQLPYLIELYRLVWGCPWCARAASSARICKSVRKWPENNSCQK